MSNTNQLPDKQSYFENDDFKLDYNPFEHPGNVQVQQGNVQAQQENAQLTPNNVNPNLPQAEAQAQEVKNEEITNLIQFLQKESKNN